MNNYSITGIITMYQTYPTYIDPRNNDFQGTHIPNMIVQSIVDVLDLGYSTIYKQVLTLRPSISDWTL